MQWAFLRRVCVCVYQEKRTPLHCAVFGDDGKIIETLVEAKADLCALHDVSVLKETSLDGDRGLFVRYMM